VNLNRQKDPEQACITPMVTWKGAEFRLPVADDKA
jgi:hypothetical protein